MCYDLHRAILGADSMNEHLPSHRALRPRYQRVENYHGNRFTPREARILHWVHKMRFLSREQIQRLEFDSKSERYCRDRLRWLYDTGHLDRRRLDLGTGFGANVPVYCLDQMGAARVALDQKMDPSELDWRPRDNDTNPYFMKHTLAINDFWIDVVLATRNSEFELEHWIDGRTLKSKEMRDYVDDPKARSKIAIIPDGYFCILLPDKRRACFALELDRGTVERKSWRRKIRGYIEYEKSGKYNERYGSSSLRVLTVVQAARRAKDEGHQARLIRNRVEAIKKWTEDQEGQQLFWFAARMDIDPRSVLLGRIWQVAGRNGYHVLIH